MVALCGRPFFSILRPRRFFASVSGKNILKIPQRLGGRRDEGRERAGGIPRPCFLLCQPVCRLLRSNFSDDDASSAPLPSPYGLLLFHSPAASPPECKCPPIMPTYRAREAEEGKKGRERQEEQSGAKRRKDGTAKRTNGSVAIHRPGTERDKCKKRGEERKKESFAIFLRARLKFFYFIPGVCFTFGALVPFIFRVFLLLWRRTGAGRGDISPALLGYKGEEEQGERGTGREGKGRKKESKVVKRGNEGLRQRSLLARKGKCIYGAGGDKRCTDHLRTGSRGRGKGGGARFRSATFCENDSAPFYIRPPKGEKEKKEGKNLHRSISWKETQLHRTALAALEIVALYCLSGLPGDWEFKVSLSREDTNTCHAFFV